jgi:hypothetical protein
MDVRIILIPVQGIHGVTILVFLSTGQGDQIGVPVMPVVNFPVSEVLELLVIIVNLIGILLDAYRVMKYCSMISLERV